MMLIVDWRLDIVNIDHQAKRQTCGIEGFTIADTIPLITDIHSSFRNRVLLFIYLDAKSS